MTSSAARQASRNVSVLAPGKINISLSVGPERPDGYHGVASVYLAVSLYEEVTATVTEGTGITVSLKKEPYGGSHWTSDRTKAENGAGVGAGIPLDSSNLAVQAASMLQGIAASSTGVHLELTKRVPVAGGMGGGSADAAAALVACDALWGSGYSRDELARMAAGLGADVPFALLGGAAVGLGVGDQLTPALCPGQLHWVLVPGASGLSTPTVYRKLDRLREAAGERPVEPQQVDPQVLQALRSGDAGALSDVLHNDLQPAALELAPELKDILERGERHGALAGMISGSGPTVAFLAGNEDRALDVAAALHDDGLEAMTVYGPVHGARVAAGIHN